jgi:hypothetical protein
VLQEVVCLRLAGGFVSIERLVAVPLLDDVGRVCTSTICRKS